MKWSVEISFGELKKSLFLVCRCGHRELPGSRGKMDEEHSFVVCQR